MRSSDHFTAGFTLTELLIVISIAGILMFVGFTAYQRSILSNRVQDASLQLAVDLRKARSLSQRQSVNTSLTFTSASGSAVSTYSLNLPSGAASITLPNAVTMTCVLGCTSSGLQSIIYKTPFGEMSSSIGGFVLQLNSPVSGISPRFVKVVGVTGKVMVSAAY